MFDDEDHGRLELEDELYADPNENDEEANSDSADSETRDDLLAAVNYNHSFTFQNVHDDHESDENGETAPPSGPVLISSDSDHSEDMEMSDNDGVVVGVDTPKPIPGTPSTPSMRTVQMRPTMAVDAIELEDLSTSARASAPRYWDNLDEFQKRGPSRFFCHYCREKGHIASQCPEKETMCYLCRADHDPLRCPLADICYNCWHRGHQSKDCDARRNYHQDCEYCDGRHSTMECAALWRHYAYSAVSGAARRPTDQLDISCFECGEHGHFGDDCNRRSGRRRTDSAFNAAAVEEEFRFERNRSQGVYYPPRRTSRSRSPGGPKARQGRTAPPPPQTHKRFRSESISSSHSSSSRSRSRSRSYSRSRSRSRSLSRSPPPRSRHDRPHMTPRTPQSSDLRSALKRGSQHGRYEDEGDDYYQTPTRGGTRTPPSRYRDGPQNGRRLQSSGNSYEDLRSSLGSSGGRHDERRGNGGQHTPLSDRMRDRLRDHRSPSPLRPYSERHQQVQKQKQKSHAPRYRGSYDGSSSSRR